jgi:hypothetical protein
MTIASATNVADDTYTLAGGDRFSVLGNGNVGIGTTAPSYKLDLGDKFFWDSNYFRTNQTRGAAIMNEAPSSTNPVFSFYGDEDTGMSRADNNKLSLITAGVEAIRIDASQNVGIGTTAPTSKLDVRGTTLLSGTTTIMGSAGGSSNNLTFDNPDATGDVVLAQGDSGWFQIDSPDDINLDAHSSVFNFKRQGSEMFRLTCDASSPITFQPKQDAYDIAFNQYDGTEVMRITDNARVGIGTDTPATKLDVVGSITAGANSYTTISNNEYDVSSGDLLIDVAGDISLDAAGNEIRFKYGGTEIGRFENSSSDFVISSIQDNKDIIFKGYDNLSYIQAAHFDMSDVGHFYLGGQLTVSGAANITGATTLKSTIGVSGAMTAPHINNTQTIEETPAQTSSVTISVSNGPLFAAKVSQGGIVAYTLPATPATGDTYRIAWDCAGSLLGQNAKITIVGGNYGGGNAQINSSTSTHTIIENTDDADESWGITDIVCIDAGGAWGTAAPKWVMQTTKVGD